eukprot:7804429-Lingulodinium_polyedra.AAC.1
MTRKHVVPGGGVAGVPNGHAPGWPDRFGPLPFDSKKFGEAVSRPDMRCPPHQGWTVPASS